MVIKWELKVCSYYKMYVFLRNHFNSRKLLSMIPIVVLWNVLFSLVALFLGEEDFFFFFLLFRTTLLAYGSSQTRGQIGATAAGKHHSHINTSSEPCLWPTPQLTAVPDPWPTVRPRIKPTSSWILIRFISSEPQWNLGIFCLHQEYEVYFFIFRWKLFSRAMW